VRSRVRERILRGNLIITPAEIIEDWRWGRRHALDALTALGPRSRSRPISSSSAPVSTLSRRAGCANRCRREHSSSDGHAGRGRTYNAGARRTQGRRRAVRTERHSVRRRYCSGSTGCRRQISRST
jgi:hypothetical protein